MDPRFHLDDASLRILGIRLGVFGNHVESFHFGTQLLAVNCKNLALLLPVQRCRAEAGWIVAEVGRQPWTVQDMLPSVASVSELAPAAVKTTFFIFAVLFTVLLVAEIRIMLRQIKNGPEAIGE